MDFYEKLDSLVFFLSPFSQNNNTIIHFTETRLQYNWHNNKNTDGFVKGTQSSV